MFCKVVYTAKIGLDRQTVETYMNTSSTGEMRLIFDKDIDWSEPIHMMIEPAVELNCHVSNVARLSYDPNIADGLIEAAVERERNRPVHHIKEGE